MIVRLDRLPRVLGHTGVVGVEWVLEGAIV